MAAGSNCLLKLAVYFWLMLHLLLFAGAQEVQLNRNEIDARIFLGTFDEMASEIYFDAATAQWNYYHDLTEPNKQKMVCMEFIRFCFCFVLFVLFVFVLFVWLVWFAHF